MPTTIKSINTVSAQKYNQVKKELDEYVHYSNLKTNRMIDLEIEIEKSKISLDALLIAYNNVLNDNEGLVRRLTAWETDCPVDGLPVADCNGFDCSVCALNV